jgi:cytochrome c-type biogenesis protein CcmF
LVKGEEGMNLSSNPGSKHYLSRDVFVYITSWLNPDSIKDTASFSHKWVGKGDTVFYSKGYIVVGNIITANKNDNKICLLWTVHGCLTSWCIPMTGRSYTSQPGYFIKDNLPSVKLDTVYTQNLVLKVNGTEGDRIELGVKESDAVMRYITLKAYQFPYINVLWLGIVIMVIGFMVSMVRRFRALDKIFC